MGVETILSFKEGGSEETQQNYLIKVENLIKVFCKKLTQMVSPPIMLECRTLLIMHDNWWGMGVDH